MKSALKTLFDPLISSTERVISLRNARKTLKKLQKHAELFEKEEEMRVEYRKWLNTALINAQSEVSDLEHRVPHLRLVKQ